jgi:hypothetical protein
MQQHKEYVPARCLAMSGRQDARTPTLRCNLEAGHASRHMAVDLRPDFTERPLWWTDEDRMPRSS